MTLLPPNASKLEKAVEAAIDYKVDVGVLAGFKFDSNIACAASTWMKLALSWEYSLSKVRIDNFADRIKQGVEFHRYCGTPYALKMAFSWYDFNSVIIEEEPPGEHFAEFQVGIEEIPNTFEVDTIIDVAKMASPVRSRLSRMYNSLYDVRRFMLDDSKFGDILSDNSGIRLKDGDPKLSFGRENHYSVQAPKISEQLFNKRSHYNFANNIDVFRLDFGWLDDSPPDAVNRKSMSFPARYVWNTDAVGSRLENLLHPNIFAKALVVLSESTLGDINSCFSGGYENVIEEPFALSFSKLSQHRTTAEQILIEERFYREKLESTKSSFIPSTSECGRFREYVAICNDMPAVILSTKTREIYQTATYIGNNTWHTHRHFNVSWNQQMNHTRIS
jgi:P2-related tail formation protein